MRPNEYILKLQLGLRAVVEGEGNTCVLCTQRIEDICYRLLVEEPYPNILYFDEACLNQLFAIGFKLIQQRLEETKN